MTEWWKPRERIKTDLRLFGFPVEFDPGLAANVVELVNPRGHKVRITVVDMVREFNNFQPYSEEGGPPKPPEGTGQ